MLDPALQARLRTAFRPHAPIDDPNAFQGRKQEREKVAEAVAEPGLQVVITGEQGAGKTSLANVGTSGVRRVQVFCERDSTFADICRAIVFQLKDTNLVPDLNFDAQTGTIRRGGLRLDATKLTGNELRALLPNDGPLCIIVDELDRLTNPETPRHLAELCKNISTYQNNITLVLVGVAETANALLKGHSSNVRNLRQIPLDRMTNVELSDILRHAERMLGVMFSVAVEKRILDTSDRLPYFLHLLGSGSARSALARNSATIEVADYAAALVSAASDCDQSLRETYEIGILSKKNSEIYRRVVWALAESDRTYLSPSEIETRASAIARSEGASPVTVQAIGTALRRLGTTEKRQIVSSPQKGSYRFTHPLMRGFVRLRREQG